ncbi:MAG: DUF3473 domain-containing protein [Phycisphaerales bacterium]|nr:DUF3473 domain-containing protein [Phycisphaerales bacterium]MBT7171297.1 DUF3473 domain-containing protein [Phycisphaerales bacterium]
MTTHMLTFDVEEFYQVEAARRAGVSPQMWAVYDSRLDVGLDSICELLDAADVRATFFILGEVARRRGDWVKRLAAAGHEIASHGMTHTMLTQLSPEAAAAELRDSKALLEELSGEAVLGFRAPTFSINHTNAWAIDALADAGYAYDSSIFPVRHDRYGVPDAPRGAFRCVGPEGGAVLEIPPLTRRVCGMTMPMGGGGYFRLVPLWWFASAIKAAARRNDPAMLYFHPWEFDADQPELPGLSGLRRWRHRVGLAKNAKKLLKLLTKFSFGPVRDQLDGLKQTDVDFTL